MKSDLSELPVADPKEADKLYSDSLKKDAGKREYSITVAGKSYSFAFQEGDAGDWFDHAVLGNVIEYRVDNARLTADLSVQVSPGMFIGNITVTFEHNDGNLKVSNQIEFHRL